MLSINFLSYKLKHKHNRERTSFRSKPCIFYVAHNLKIITLFTYTIEQSEAWHNLSAKKLSLQMRKFSFISRLRQIAKYTLQWIYDETYCAFLHQCNKLGSTQTEYRVKGYKTSENMPISIMLRIKVRCIARSTIRFTTILSFLYNYYMSSSLSLSLSRLFLRSIL